jgi:glycosidase
MSPGWLNGRALYQLHSLGASGAPAANPDVRAGAPCGRGFARLAGWLDHVAALGCGGVLLTPVFVSSTHGYDTADPFRVDQRLGDEDDFGAFVAACHERDLKVVLDGVFNHAGREFGPFRDVLEHREASAFTDWFRLDFSRDGGDGFAYESFEGHRELVALNHRSDAVLDWAAAVANHWLDRGADGWRFDAAYAIPVEFLRRLTDRIRERHPEAFLFGEVIHGDYARFVTEGGLDSVTQYELHKAIWSSLNDANFFELRWALQRHEGFPPVTFVGNHDVTRIASQLHELRHLPAAVATVLTVPGVPCVYYGDEYAWRGRKEHRPGGDDAIRTPLPDRADPDGEEQRWALDVHRTLLAFRRARPWLTHGRLALVEVRNERIVWTVTGDGGAIHVTLDADGADVPVPDGWHEQVRVPGVLICDR